MRQHLTQTQRLATVGTMASEIAHEINNPLMSMINLAQLIADRETNPEIQKMGQEIIAEGERITRIAHNLLDFTRNESEKYETVLLATLVEDVLSLTKMLFEKNGIQLNVEGLRSHLPVTCKPDEVRQIIINLLCNARDALNEKYPDQHPCKKVALVLDENHGSARLSVRDTGPGIPAQIAPHIFRPFYTTKPKKTGTGLGLSISRDILEKHGGSIHFTSEPGEGACFIMTLPLADRQPASCSV